jgi:hypothetical protein
MLDLLQWTSREKRRSILPAIRMLSGCNKYDVLEFRQSIGQLRRLIFAVFTRRILSNRLKRDDVRAMLPNGLRNQFSSDGPAPVLALAKIQIQRHDLHRDILRLETPQCNLFDLMPMSGIWEETYY